jgi:endoglucanase
MRKILTSAAFLFASTTLAITPHQNAILNTGCANDISGGKTGLQNDQGQFGYLLPPGYLYTSGNQIVDSNGNPVRLACVGYFQFTNYVQDVAGMVADGFNCARLQWRDATLSADFTDIDATVAAAKTYGLKIILDHHLDEAGSSCDNYSQQVNGLWIDSGTGTNGTDGCVTGTVTAAAFQNDWLTVASRYANNPTVIGFDLDNEPLAYSGMSVWGGIHKMYQDVGNAILAVNPNVLIIAEGPSNYGGCFSGSTGRRGGLGTCPEGDLTMVASQPVILNIPGKLVYSVHLYPNEISDYTPDSGADAIVRMNAAWGYIVEQNLAPVWIGEMGSSMTTNPDDTNWANTLTSYVNGTAASGPRFAGEQQGIGTDWWAWGDLTDEVPQGTLSGTTPRPEQQVVTKQLMYIPDCH